MRAGATNHTRAKGRRCPCRRGPQRAPTPRLGQPPVSRRVDAPAPLPARRDSQPPTVISRTGAADERHRMNAEDAADRRIAQAKRMNVFRPCSPAARSQSGAPPVAGEPKPAGLFPSERRLWPANAPLQPRWQHRPLPVRAAPPPRPAGRGPMPRGGGAPPRRRGTVKYRNRHAALRNRAGPGRVPGASYPCASPAAHVTDGGSPPSMGERCWHGRRPRRGGLAAT